MFLRVFCVEVVGAISSEDFLVHVYTFSCRAPLSAAHVVHVTVKNIFIIKK